MGGCIDSTDKLSNDKIAIRYPAVGVHERKRNRCNGAYWKPSAGRCKDTGARWDVMEVGVESIFIGTAIIRIFLFCIPISWRT